MPNYRRHYVDGGTFFFTLVTHERVPILIEHRDRLRRAIAECKQRFPFEIVAIVVLPDHLHTVWELPANDSDYSKRWSIIKRLFAQDVWLTDETLPRQSRSREAHRRLPVWQKRFWEHWVRDENELLDVVDYIHFNPVKHGYARCVHDWPYSSFERMVDQGQYTREWCCTCENPTIDARRFYEAKWDAFEA